MTKALSPARPTDDARAFLDQHNDIVSSPDVMAQNLQEMRTRAGAIGPTSKAETLGASMFVYDPMLLAHARIEEKLAKRVNSLRTAANKLPNKLKGTAVTKGDRTKRLKAAESAANLAVEDLMQLRNMKKLILDHKQRYLVDGDDGRVPSIIEHDADTVIEED